MPPCDHPHCNECTSLGPPSPGTIDDAERIVRGAYDSHYNKSGQAIISQFPRLKDIVGQQLSVWRMDKGLAGNPQATRALVQSNGPNAGLRECIVFTAAGLRGIQTHDSQRALCVFDDTIIDLAGNKHPEHAAVGLCKRIDPAPYKIAESDAAMKLVRTLVAYTNSQRELGNVI